MITIRVLIIDDSMTMRAMIEQVVSADAGFRVIGVVSDVDAAIAAMRDSRPDVVTLDLMMPGVDGLQFLEDVAEAAHVPIVVVSSLSKATAKETTRALAAGAAACFDKSRLLQEVPKLLRTLRRAAENNLSPCHCRRGKPAVRPGDAPTDTPAPPPTTARSEEWTVRSST